MTWMILEGIRLRWQGSGRDQRSWGPFFEIGNCKACEAMGQVKLPLVKRITCVLCTVNSGGVSSSLWSYDTVCAWCCGSHQRSGYEHSQPAQQKNHQCVRDASFSSSLETKVGVPPSSFMWGPRHVLGERLPCGHVAWWGLFVHLVCRRHARMDYVAGIVSDIRKGLCTQIVHVSLFLMFMPDWSHQSHLLLWIFSLFAVLIQDRTCTWLNLANTQFLHPALRIQRFNEHINEPRTQSTEPQRNQERKERRLLKGHEEDIHFFSNFSACQDLSARPVWTQCSQDLNGTANRRTGEREFRSKTSWGTNLDRSGYLGGLFFFCKYTNHTLKSGPFLLFLMFFFARQTLPSCPEIDQLHLPGKS